VATGRESESATAASRFEDIFEVMAVAKRLAKDLTGVDLGTWTAGKSAGTVDRDFNDEKTGISMVFVQGGTTVFGCGNISESRTEYSGECAGVAESPEAKMTLKDYYISRYEITQEEWVKVMGSNPSHFQARFLERLPVENISYGDVQTFIAKLNAMTGRKYRLPSYIEWYYAALGGVKSKGYNYIGSDNIRDVAWFMENSDQKTHEVGQRAPNELRLYDMAGNVWEFVSLSPAGEEGYAFVGGGWNSGITLLKPSILTQETGDPKYPVLGFRLALDP
jgi:formylglycine-generating enzyme required for sulfatase activity